MFSLGDLVDFFVSRLSGSILLCCIAFFCTAEAGADAMMCSSLASLTTPLRSSSQHTYVSLERVNTLGSHGHSVQCIFHSEVVFGAKNTAIHEKYNMHMSSSAKSNNMTIILASQIALVG